MMQKRIKVPSNRSLRIGLFALFLIGSQILGQSFVTTGGTVTSGYWNATNTGGTASFIVPNDGSIAFVSLQIEVNNNGTYTQIGDVEAASAQQSKVLTRTATQIESSGSFGDGDSFDIVVVFITGGLVSVDTTTLATNVTVDQTAPSAFQVGSVTTTGGNVSAGYWNGSNTALEVTVPIGNDASLQNGSLQIAGFVGGNPAEDLGSAASVLIISTNQTVTLSSTDFINKAWFLDSQTFSLTATLSDAAGNSTDATASATTLSIDQTAPSVSSITSSTADGTYGVSGIINITVTFDESVTLSGGSLLTNLNTGAQLTTSAFTSTSFSENYTISEGEEASSLTVSSFALSGGSAKLLDAAGNNADIATITSNLENNTNLVVDGSTPSISGISSSTTNGSYGVDEIINITITFSESLTLSGGNLLANIDASGTDVTITPFSNSVTASGIYTVSNGDASSDLTVTSLSLSGGTLVDAGGNAVNLDLTGVSNINDAKNIAIDGAAPADFIVSTVSITGGDVVASYWNGTNTGIDITVPIANDASLENGTVQIQGFFGDISGAENVGSTTTILGANLGGNVTVSLTATQLEGLTGFSDGETLKITAILADAGGNSTTGTQSANTFYVDQTVPTISSVSSSTADGTHGIGDAVNVTIVFSENVTLAGGNLLTNLNTSAQLSTSSISNTNTLSQTYTISALDESSDLAVSSLALSAGSVDLMDAAGNSIDLTLPTGANSLAGSSALVIDGIVPTISSITSTSSDGSYGVGDVITVKVTFSENMTLSGGNLLVTLETGTTDRQVTISSLSDSTGSGTYTVQSGDASDDLTATALSLSAGTLQDAGGNDVNLADLTGITNIADGSNIAVDGANPAAFTVGTITVTGGNVVSTYWNNTNTGMTVVIPIASDNSLVGGSVQVQGYFNDILGAVNVGSPSTIAGGHLGGNLTIALDSSAVEGITGFADNLTLKMTAVITDAGGNSTTGAPSANTFSIDQTAPTITTINSTTSNATYGVGDNIDVTITLTENVTLSGGNLLTTLNTATQLTTTTISNTNSLSQTYTVAENDQSSDLSVSSLALSVGTADLVDIAGNQADLSLPVGNNLADNSAIAIDGILPTLSSISSTSSNGSYGSADTINITLTFSEQVTLSGGNLVIDHDASTTDVLISSLSNSSTVSQTYTVASGDASSDLAVTGLSLSAGSLVDAGGNNVDLTDISAISNINDTRNIVVDGISPADFQVGAVVTTGGTVVAEYWNDSNTGISITVPIANDASLQNGKVLIMAKIGANAFEAVGDSSTILAVDASKTMTLSKTAVAGITGYNEVGAIITFTAKMRDAVYNYKTGTASNTTLTIDKTAPTIRQITSNPSIGTLGVAGSVDITIDFSESVTLGGGSIVTTLETGDSDAQLTTSAFSNASSITETYSVSENEITTDLDVQLIALTAGTWRDAAGNDMDYSLPADSNLADLSQIVIDGIVPTILTITSTSSDAISYGFNDAIDLVIEFSEPLTLSGGNLIITLETGDTDQQVSISSISNSSTASGTYTIQDGDVSSDLTVNSVSLSAGSLEDAAGNALDYTLPTGGNSLAGSYDFVVDGSVPADFTVGSVTTVGGVVTSGYWNRLNTDVQVTVPIASDISLQNGSLQIQARAAANPFADIGSSVTIPSVGVNQTVSIANSAILLIDGYSENATLEFTAVITDIVGNSTTGIVSATSLVVDRVDPTISSITSSPITGSFSIGDFVDISVNFSEALTLDADILTVTLETGDSDVELTRTTIAAEDSITLRYTVSENEVSSDLNVIGLDIGLGTLRDAAGNEIDLSLPIANNLADNSALVIDGNIPSIESISSLTLTDSLGLGETLDIDLIFSDAVTLSGGSLVLTLNTGRDVSISTITSSTSASGTYVVQAGDESFDLSVANITLPAGLLEDAAGNDADLSLPPGNNLADNNAILVDGNLPNAFDTGDIITLGDSVVTGYWNQDNTAMEVILPVTGSDASLNGGTAYLEARINSNTFSLIGNVDAVAVNPVTLTLTRTQLENELAGYFAGGTIQVRGVLTDIAGNSTTGATSGVSLIIDQVDPTQTTTGDIVVSGGIENQGYWNSTNVSLTVYTDLDGDNSLIDGTLQLQGRIGTSGNFSDVGNPVVLDVGDLGTTFSRVILAAELSTLGISDGDTLFFRAEVIDVAGNLTNGLPGVNTIIVDTSFPADFTVGSVTALNGVVVSNYYNATNDGVEVTIPIDLTDNSLIGGTIELLVSVNGNPASNLQGPDAIISLGDFTFSIADASLQAVYTEGDILTFTAIITDASGNATLGSESPDQLEIDETLPVAFDFTDIVTTGGIIVAGFWNSTNTGLDISVPIDNDATLIGGNLQISGDLVAGNGNFETFATSQIISALTGSVQISLPDTDIEGLEGGTGFVDGLTIEFRSTITDVAGNAATSITSAMTLEIDQTEPVAPDISAVEIFGINTVNSVWSQGADSLYLTILDNSEVGGFIQVLMSIGNSPDENAYELVVTDSFLIPLTNNIININKSDVENLSGFSDLRTLYTRLLIHDQAGNETISATSTYEILIDVNPPDPFDCGLLSATGGTVVIENAYNIRNDGISLIVPIVSDPSLEGGMLILKMGIEDPFNGNLVTFEDIDTLVIVSADLGTDVTMSATEAEVEALVNYQNGAKIHATAALLDYAGNQAQGNESLNTLIVDLVRPDLPIVNDTTTSGGVSVAGYWNDSNTGIDVVVGTPTATDPSLVNGYFQIQGRIGAAPDFVSLGDSVPMQINDTELTANIDAATLEALPGFGDNLFIDLRVRMVDGSGNDTLGNIIEDWLLTDQVSPELGGFVAGGTTPGPFIHAADTLRVEWEGFSDVTTGISGYEYSIGNSVGESNFLDWINLDLTTHYDTLMTYVHADSLYMNVRALDVAGNLSDTLSSPAIIVDLESPSSTSTSETYYLIDDWANINSFGGTYGDGLAGVDSLWLDLSRESDSLYWNGSDWGSDSISLGLDITAHDGIWNYSISSDTLSNHENYFIRLLAVDSAGNRQAEATLDTFQFIINSAPVIFTFASDTTTLEDSLFSYLYHATDPDFETTRGDTLRFSLSVNAPAGMSIDSTGLLTWTPVDSAVGEHIYTTYVSDLLGLQDSIESTLTVLNVNDAPEPVTLLLPIDSTQLVPEDSLLLTFTWTPAFDIEDNPVSYEITMQGQDYEATMATSDTFLTVDVSVMDFPITVVEWFVHALDAEDISDTSEIFAFTTSAAFAELNTNNVVIEMQRNRSQDTLITLKNLGLTDLRWSLLSTPTWMTLVTESGTIEYQDSSAITFNINPADSTIGGFVDTLRLLTNDPLQDTLSITVSVGIFDIPTPVLAFYKNPAYPGFYEMMIVDSLGMIDTLILSHAGEQLAIDTIGAFSYLATIEIASEGQNSFELYASNWVGDTTITASIAVSLARPSSKWLARSSDQQFEVQGTVGSVNYTSQVTILDTILSRVDKARYKILSDNVTLAEPVLVSMLTEVDEQAIYVKTLSGEYVELPSMDNGEQISAWTERLGAFKMGPRTIVVPERSQLSQNYPNPFNPSTTIEYDIGFLDGLNQDIKFSIYNIRGQEVRNLVRSQVQPGEYAVIWNGLDEQGKQVSSGIYFARLITGKGYVKTVKMLVLR